VMALKEIEEGALLLAPSAGAVRDGTLVTRAPKTPTTTTGAKP